MISVVIPNYNGVHHLEVCLNSLREQTYKNFKVHLVDNNSSDDSAQFTREYYPEVEIIRLNYNTGFAKAVNEGIKHSIENETIKYILLLNNDIECDPHFLEEMLKGFKSEAVGSVACKMLNYFNRDVIDDAGDFIKKKGSPYPRGYGEKDTGQYDKEEFIWGACAGAALYRKEIFETAGFFDEDFFAYYEDVDFNFRLQLMGYKCYYNPHAVCYHKRGATLRDKGEVQTMYCEKNLVALRLKNYPINLLIRWFPFFMLVRLKRYSEFLIYHSPKLCWFALKGYLKGLSEIPKSLSKRKEIQRKRKVSVNYIESLFR